MITNLSLFDVEDATEAPKVRDMTVAHVSTKDVTEFCQRYHYTATGGNMTWRYGLWNGPVLMGVAAYNLPTRDVCESVFGPEHFDHVWHMGRLALAESAPRNSESRLIGGSLRRMQHEAPAVWAVVTYAATDAGHIGYVYQATNAIYTGEAGTKPSYQDSTGAHRGSYLGGAYVSPDRAESMGWIRRSSGPKHRYLYILGDRRQRRERRAMLRYPSLPYPKFSGPSTTRKGVPT